MLNLENQTLLVTGGTGSLGKKLVESLSAKYPNIKKIIIYSRGEFGQHQVSQEFHQQGIENVEFIIGDVRDKAQLTHAMKDVDIVIHTAALKHVLIAEKNPFECIKTNILGAENIVEVAIESNVKKVIAISTDKAAAPISLYGASKLCSDKLFVAANNMSREKSTVFSVVRFGNFWGSRGSVVPFFNKIKDKGKLPITHPEMTRFNILLEEAIELVLYALENAIGGEIFTPKIPSYKLLDLADSICEECEKEIIGARPGEKIHEIMIAKPDAKYTLELEKYYVTIPVLITNNNTKKFTEKYGENWVADDFEYSSETNSNFLSISQLRDLLAKSS